MKKGYIFIFLATAFFSTMEIALKIVANDFNPIQITFLRFLIGAIILFPLAVKGLRSKSYRLKANDFAFFALTGCICVVVSMVFYQMAILYTQASVVAVLFSCNPVFVVLFALIILHEKIYRHTVLSIIVSLLGIIVIMDPLHMSGNALGLVLTILSAVTFALYGVIGRQRSDRYGSIALTCFSFLCGSMEMLLLIMIARIGVVAAFLTQIGLKPFADVPILHGLSMQSLPSLIYIGIFVTGLGYTFYFLAMEATSAATASLVFFIKPALAPILALIIIREPITTTMAIGILLIITGSLISLFPAFRLSGGKEPKEDQRGAQDDSTAEIPPGTQR